MARRERTGRALRSRSARQDRLAVCEAQLRRYEAQLHEITATVAGITSAAEVLPMLPAEKRGHFETMMSAELRRLQRVVAGTADETLQSVAIDDVVAPLVTAHRARGCTVAWQPTDLSAHGNADVISEALNVLLDNAARHGDANDIRVAANLHADRVQILVTDRGPGIDAAVRGHLFEWGRQRPGSPGRGIGLAVARNRLREWGGDLRLEHRPEHHGVTTFVIDVPAARTPLVHSPVVPDGSPALVR